jgi:quinol monooxygenase YgiN
MFGLYGKIKTQPGQRDALIGILLKAAAMMPDVEGCYVYVINSAPDDPDAIWVTEIWRSQADHEASLTLDSVKSLITSAMPMIAEGSQRIEVTPLGGKGLPGSSI